ncbi:MAG: hypothetical protein AAFW76_12230, partial [Pseudomonadota bacterium]
MPSSETQADHDGSAAGHGARRLVPAIAIALLVMLTGIFLVFPGFFERLSGGLAFWGPQSADGTP